MKIFNIQFKKNVIRKKARANLTGIFVYKLRI